MPETPTVSKPNRQATRMVRHEFLGLFISLKVVLLYYLGLNYSVAGQLDITVLSTVTLCLLGVTLCKPPQALWRPPSPLIPAV